MSSTVRPALASALLRRRRGAGQHDHRVGAGHGGAHDAGARGQPVALPGLLGADHHQRGAVDDAAGVAGGVHVVDPLDPVVLVAARPRRSRPCRRCRRTPTAARPATRRWCRGGRARRVSRTTVPLRSRHRDDGAVEVAVGPGLGGAGVGLGGVRVDVLAAPAGSSVAIRSAPMPWGTKPVADGGLGVHRPGAAVGAHRHARHRLDAAGEHEVLEAGADLLRGQVDRLQAAGAEPVDLHAGHGVGQAGGERRRPGDDGALLADRRDDAEDDVVDQRRVEAGVAPADLVDQAGGQADRLDRVQRAGLLALAARGAHGVVDERLGGHASSSLGAG